MNELSDLECDRVTVEREIEARSHLSLAKMMRCSSWYKLSKGGADSTLKSKCFSLSDTVGKPAFSILVTAVWAMATVGNSFHAMGFQAPYLATKSIQLNLLDTGKVDCWSDSHAIKRREEEEAMQRWELEIFKTCFAFCFAFALHKLKVWAKIIK